MFFRTKSLGQKETTFAAKSMILLILISLLFCGKIYADPSPEDDSTVDFVLVLDNSGTMARSDPEGLTTAAAKMFIDMLPQKNARVAVVEFGSNYGDRAYSKEKYSEYVSVSFPLSDITSTEQKEACKDVIGQTTQDGEYTPVGYAFQAACDVLQKGRATQGDAGILLISDFRVTGQKKEDFLDGGYNYQSLVDAQEIAAGNQWPVYTLELNFDGKNDHPTDYTERIGARLRSDIPEKVGYGEYIPLTNAEDAKDRFAEIFKLFFDPNNEDGTQGQEKITDENGEAVFDFSVGEMVAELNVTLTCEDSSMIRSIEVGRSDRMNEYDLTQYSEPVQETDRTITKDEQHITIKLMVPAPGDDWKVVVHGEAETAISMYALSVHDMNIQLTAVTDSEPNADGSVTVRQNSPVQFRASYIYNGLPYDSGQVYSAYPVVLEIIETGEQIPMSPGQSDYTASVSFDECGTYTLKAVASGSTFRTGSIETGECKVIVEKRSVMVNEDAVLEPDRTLKPEESFEINCADYFIGPDGEPLVYSVELEPGSSELKCVQDGDILKITAGITASKTAVTITAGTEGEGDAGNTENTSSGADPAQIEFTVTVTNNPVVSKGFQSDPYVFAWHRDQVPEFLRSMAEQSAQIGQDGNLRISWSEVFSDPDGYPPVITVRKTDPDQAIVLFENSEGITVRAAHPGEATYEITARDANDPTVKSYATLNITAYDAKEFILQKVRGPARIAIIALAAIVVLIIVRIILKRRGRRQDL